MKDKLLLCTVVLALFAESAQPGQITNWRNYKNQRWGFCVAYPRGWGHNEGVNNAGIAVFPVQDSPPGLQSQISVGALPPGRVNGHLLTLEESFEGEDEVLREGGATGLVVLDKHNLTFSGQPALFRKIRYKEKSSGAVWVEETIAFQSGPNYYFQLKCHPPELAELEPVFNKMVFKTFRSECRHEH